LKARVGLEALKGSDSVRAIASRYEVYPVQVSQWKKEAAERLPEVFARYQRPRETDPLASV
jgi:transposase